jgi:hypothetical protein
MRASTHASRDAHLLARVRARSAPFAPLADETGHNLGRQHTFQNGQGKTGGIMDYSDSTYPQGSGITQFMMSAAEGRALHSSGVLDAQLSMHAHAHLPIDEFVVARMYASS